MDQACLSFQDVFEKMQIPRFLIRASEEGAYIVLAANALALKYFDLSAEQVIGKRIQDFMDHENALHFQQSFEVASAKRRSVSIQALPGVPGNVKVYGFYISPIASDTGCIEYLDVIGQINVSDQSILQRERDDAISLMSSIFDVSEVGILVMDYNGRIVRVNDSFVRTYGWARDDLINAEIVQLVPPDEREGVRRDHEECIRSGLRASGEMRIVRKDGSLAHVLFTTATLELSQKRRFQVKTVMDITLRKQMEQSLYVAKDQADAANRAKSVFLANMSHELRTPLNAIIGFSEMMIKETFGPLGNLKYEEYMGDVYSSAHHLLEIINEVLDMSKIEAGRIDLDEGEADIQALIRSVIRMMDSRAFGSNVTLRCTLAESLPNLRADQRLIRQILINLVGNAVKFSKAGGGVDVSAQMQPDGQMRIVVKDEGIGIPKDKLKQALEPFGQVSDRPENSHYQGTGLGLPLAKAMVELHGGHLWLESELGQGTSVLITFPASRILPRSSAPPPYSDKGDAVLAS